MAHGEVPGAASLLAVGAITARITTTEPLAKDKKAGDLNGQGFVHFGGSWWVVSSAGAKITRKP
jgi:hypothetical protein